MSGTDELAGLYSAIEESARLVNVSCSREKVWPILTAYGEELANSVIAFRVGTGARHTGELDCRFTLPKDSDPYGRALSNGFTTETGHPVDALLSDVQERCPVGGYAIDFGVVSGFSKIWAFFPPDDFQQLSKLAEISSMPRGLADNFSFFARHGLDKVSLVGIDYRYRTVNVYLGDPLAGGYEPEAILSMLRETELPDPSEQLLKLGEKAFGIYATLSWDSSKIERVTFPVMTPDPMTLPVHLEPIIEQFVRNVPCDSVERNFVYAVALTATGEYCKLQSYYRWRPRVLESYYSKSSMDSLG
jgi:Aromatic prenyltransferase Orf2